jgi:hypothetical protein
MGAITTFLRWRIRRIYNFGNYEGARLLALRYFETQPTFCYDIILRALWNLNRYQELIDFSASYPEFDSLGYVQKAAHKLRNRVNKVSPPSEIHGKMWNAEQLTDNWYQVEDTLWLRYPGGWVHWRMPDGYDLQQTHPSLVELASEVLLTPLIGTFPPVKTQQRPQGKNIGLAFSGGIDSMAASILLPEETILAYHRRNFDSHLHHGLANELFMKIEETFGRHVLQVPSNHELIRQHVGKPTGFSTDLAAGVHLLLLADYLDLGVVAFGTPIDNTWLSKGRKYRDFSASTYWLKWTKRFNHAGLKLEFPLNHISEAGAIEICKQHPLLPYINSCLRGDGLNGCGKCWKCFHKNGPLGRAFDVNSPEVSSFLTKTPLRTAQHALWAIQYLKLEAHVPHLKLSLQDDLSWWTGYYPPGLNLIGEPLRHHVESVTNRFLAPMPFPYSLEHVNIEH